MVAPVARRRRPPPASLTRDRASQWTTFVERDTPELLARYVSAFDARFLALRGDAEATARTAREFRVFSQKNPPDARGAYAVDHSAGLYLIDPKGKLRVYLGPGKGAQALAHDLKLLIEGA